MKRFFAICLATFFLVATTLSAKQPPKEPQHNKNNPGVQPVAAKPVELAPVFDMFAGIYHCDFTVQKSLLLAGLGHPEADPRYFEYELPSSKRDTVEQYMYRYLKTLGTRLYLQNGQEALPNRIQTVQERWLAFRDGRLDLSTITSDTDLLNLWFFAENTAGRENHRATDRISVDALAKLATYLRSKKKFPGLFERFYETSKHDGSDIALRASTLIRTNEGRLALLSNLGTSQKKLMLDGKTISALVESGTLEDWKKVAQAGLTTSGDLLNVLDPLTLAVIREGLLAAMDRHSHEEFAKAAKAMKPPVAWPAYDEKTLSQSYAALCGGDTTGRRTGQYVRTIEKLRTVLPPHKTAGVPSSLWPRIQDERSLQLLEIAASLVDPANEAERERLMGFVLRIATAKDDDRGKVNAELEKHLGVFAMVPPSLEIDEPDDSPNQIARSQKLLHKYLTAAGIDPKVIAPLLTGKATPAQMADIREATFLSFQRNISQNRVGPASQLSEFYTGDLKKGAFDGPNSRFHQTAAASMGLMLMDGHIAKSVDDFRNEMEMGGAGVTHDRLREFAQDAGAFHAQLRNPNASIDASFGLARMTQNHGELPRLLADVDFVARGGLFASELRKIQAYWDSVTDSRQDRFTLTLNDLQNKLLGPKDVEARARSLRLLGLLESGKVGRDLARMLIENPTWPVIQFAEQLLGIAKQKPEPFKVPDNGTSLPTMALLAHMYLDPVTTAQSKRTAPVAVDPTTVAIFDDFYRKNRYTALSPTPGGSLTQEKNPFLARVRLQRMLLEHAYGDLIRSATPPPLVPPPKEHPNIELAKAHLTFLQSGLVSTPLSVTRAKEFIKYWMLRLEELNADWDEMQEKLRIAPSPADEIALRDHMKLNQDERDLISKLLFGERLSSGRFSVFRPPFSKPYPWQQAGYEWTQEAIKRDMVPRVPTMKLSELLGLHQAFKRAKDGKALHDPLSRLFSTHEKALEPLAKAIEEELLKPSRKEKIESVRLDNLARASRIPIVGYANPIEPIGMFELQTLGEAMARPDFKFPKSARPASFDAASAVSEDELNDTAAVLNYDFELSLAGEKDIYGQDVFGKDAHERQRLSAFRVAIMVRQRNPGTRFDELRTALHKSVDEYKKIVEKLDEQQQNHGAKFGSAELDDVTAGRPFASRPTLVPLDERTEKLQPFRNGVRLGEKHSPVDITLSAKDGQKTFLLVVENGNDLPFQELINANFKVEAGNGITLVQALNRTRKQIRDLIPAPFTPNNLAGYVESLRKRRPGEAFSSVDKSILALANYARNIERALQAHAPTLVLPRLEGSTVDYLQTMMAVETLAPVAAVNGPDHDLIQWAHGRWGTMTTPEPKEAQVPLEFQLALHKLDPATKALILQTNPKKPDTGKWVAALLTNPSNVTVLGTLVRRLDGEDPNDVADASRKAVAYLKEQLKGFDNDLQKQFGANWPDYLLIPCDKRPNPVPFCQDQEKVRQWIANELVKQVHDPDAATPRLKNARGEQMMFALKVIDATRLIPPTQHLHPEKLAFFTDPHADTATYLRAVVVEQTVCSKLSDSSKKAIASVRARDAIGTVSHAQLCLLPQSALEAYAKVSDELRSVDEEIEQSKKATNGIPISRRLTPARLAQSYHDLRAALREPTLAGTLQLVRNAAPKFYDVWAPIGMQRSLRRIVIDEFKEKYRKLNEAHLKLLANDKVPGFSTIELSDAGKKNIALLADIARFETLGAAVDTNEIVQDQIKSVIENNLRKDAAREIYAEFFKTRDDLAARREKDNIPVTADENPIAERQSFQALLRPAFTPPPGAAPDYLKTEIMRALGNDAEAAHDFRVASKTLRNADEKIKPPQLSPGVSGGPFYFDEVMAQANPLLRALPSGHPFGIWNALTSTVLTADCDDILHMRRMLMRELREAKYARDFDPKRRVMHSDLMELLSQYTATLENIKQDTALRRKRKELQEKQEKPLIDLSGINISKKIEEERAAERLATFNKRKIELEKQIRQAQLAMKKYDTEQILAAEKREQTILASDQKEQKKFNDLGCNFSSPAAIASRQERAQKFLNYWRTQSLPVLTARLKEIDADISALDKEIANTPPGKALAALEAKKLQLLKRAETTEDQIKLATKTSGGADDKEAMRLAGQIIDRLDLSNARGQDLLLSALSPTELADFHRQPDRASKLAFLQKQMSEPGNAPLFEAWKTDRRNELSITPDESMELLLTLANQLNVERHPHYVGKGALPPALQAVALPKDVCRDHAKYFQQYGVEWDGQRLNVEKAKLYNEVGGKPVAWEEADHRAFWDHVAGMQYCSPAAGDPTADVRGQLMAFYGSGGELPPYGQPPKKERRMYGMHSFVLNHDTEVHVSSVDGRVTFKFHPRFDIDGFSKQMDQWVSATLEEKKTSPESIKAFTDARDGMAALAARSKSKAIDCQFRATEIYLLKSLVEKETGKLLEDSNNLSAPFDKDSYVKRGTDSVARAKKAQDLLKTYLDECGGTAIAVSTKMREDLKKGIQKKYEGKPDPAAMQDEIAKIPEKMEGFSFGANLGQTLHRDVYAAEFVTQDVRANIEAGQWLYVEGAVALTLHFTGVAEMDPTGVTQQYVNATKITFQGMILNEALMQAKPYVGDDLAKYLPTSRGRWIDHLDGNHHSFAMFALSHVTGEALGLTGLPPRWANTLGFTVVGGLLEKDPDPWKKVLAGMRAGAYAVPYEELVGGALGPMNADVPFLSMGLMWGTNVALDYYMAQEAADTEIARSKENAKILKPLAESLEEEIKDEVRRQIALGVPEAVIFIRDAAAMVNLTNGIDLSNEEIKKILDGPKNQLGHSAAFNLYFAVQNYKAAVRNRSKAELAALGVDTGPHTLTVAELEKRLQAKPEKDAEGQVASPRVRLLRLMAQSFTPREFMKFYDEAYPADGGNGNAEKRILLESPEFTKMFGASPKRLAEAFRARLAKDRFHLIEHKAVAQLLEGAQADIAADIRKDISAKVDELKKTPNDFERRKELAALREETMTVVPSKAMDVISIGSMKPLSVKERSDLIDQMLDAKYGKGPKSPMVQELGKFLKATFANEGIFEGFDQHQNMMEVARPFFVGGRLANASVPALRGALVDGAIDPEMALRFYDRKVVMDALDSMRKEDLDAIAVRWEAEANKSVPPMRAGYASVPLVNAKTQAALLELDKIYGGGIGELRQTIPIYLMPKDGPATQLMQMLAMRNGFHDGTSFRRSYFREFDPVRGGPLPPSPKMTELTAPEMTTAKRQEKINEFLRTTARNPVLEPLTIQERIDFANYVENIAVKNLKPAANLHELLVEWTKHGRDIRAKFLRVREGYNDLDPEDKKLVGRIPLAALDLDGNPNHITMVQELSKQFGFRPNTLVEVTRGLKMLGPNQTMGPEDVVMRMAEMRERFLLPPGQGGFTLSERAQLPKALLRDIRVSEIRPTQTSYHWEAAVLVLRGRNNNVTNTQIVDFMGYLYARRKVGTPTEKAMTLDEAAGEFLKQQGRPR